MGGQQSRSSGEYWCAQTRQALGGEEDINNDSLNIDYEPYIQGEGCTITGVAEIDMLREQEKHGLEEYIGDYESAQEIKNNYIRKIAQIFKEIGVKNIDPDAPISDLVSSITKVIGPNGTIVGDEDKQKELSRKIARAINNIYSSNESGSKKLLDENQSPEAIYRFTIEWIDALMTPMKPELLYIVTLMSKKLSDIDVLASTAGSMVSSMRNEIDKLEDGSKKEQMKNLLGLTKNIQDLISKYSRLLQIKLGNIRSIKGKTDDIEEQRKESKRLVKEILESDTSSMKLSKAAGKVLYSFGLFADYADQIKKALSEFHITPEEFASEKMSIYNFKELIEKKKDEIGSSDVSKLVELDDFADSLIKAFDVRKFLFKGGDEKERKLEVRKMRKTVDVFSKMVNTSDENMRRSIENISKKIVDAELMFDDIDKFKEFRKRLNEYLEYCMDGNVFIFKIDPSSPTFMLDNSRSKAVMILGDIQKSAREIATIGDFSELVNTLIEGINGIKNSIDEYMSLINKAALVVDEVFTASIRTNTVMLDKSIKRIKKALSMSELTAYMREYNSSVDLSEDEQSKIIEKMVEKYMEGLTKKTNKMVNEIKPKVMTEDEIEKYFYYRDRNNSPDTIIPSSVFNELEKNFPKPDMKKLIKPTISDSDKEKLLTILGDQDMKIKIALNSIMRKVNKYISIFNHSAGMDIKKYQKLEKMFEKAKISVYSKEWDKNLEELERIIVYFIDKEYRMNIEIDKFSRFENFITKKSIEIFNNFPYLSNIISLFAFIGDIEASERDLKELRDDIIRYMISLSFRFKSFDNGVLHFSYDEPQENKDELLWFYKPIDAMVGKIISVFKMNYSLSIPLAEDESTLIIGKEFNGLRPIIGGADNIMSKNIEFYVSMIRLCLFYRLFFDPKKEKSEDFCISFAPSEKNEVFYPFLKRIFVTFRDYANYSESQYRQIIDDLNSILMTYGQKNPKTIISDFIKSVNDNIGFYMKSKIEGLLSRKPRSAISGISIASSPFDTESSLFRYDSDRIMFGEEKEIEKFRSVTSIISAKNILGVFINKIKELINGYSSSDKYDISFEIPIGLSESEKMRKIIGFLSGTHGSVSQVSGGGVNVLETYVNDIIDLTDLMLSEFDEDSPSKRKIFLAMFGKSTSKKILMLDLDFITKEDPSKLGVVFRNYQTFIDIFKNTISGLRNIFGKLRKYISREDSKNIESRLNNLSMKLDKSFGNSRDGFKYENEVIISSPDYRSVINEIPENEMQSRNLDKVLSIEERRNIKIEYIYPPDDYFSYDQKNCIYEIVCGILLNFYDTLEERIYIGAIQSILNAPSFLRFERSLVDVLITKYTKKVTNKPDMLHIIRNISEISPLMKDKIKVMIPYFIRNLDFILGKLYYGRTILDESSTVNNNIEILAKNIKNDLTNTSRQLYSSEEKYLDMSENYLDNYFTQNQSYPIAKKLPTHIMNQAFTFIEPNTESYMVLRSLVPFVTDTVLSEKNCPSFKQLLTNFNSESTETINDSEFFDLMNNYKILLNLNVHDPGSVDPFIITPIVESRISSSISLPKGVENIFGNLYDSNINPFRFSSLRNLIPFSSVFTYSSFAENIYKGRFREYNFEYKKLFGEDTSLDITKIFSDNFRSMIMKIIYSHSMIVNDMNSYEQIQRNGDGVKSLISFIVSQNRLSTDRFPGITKSPDNSDQLMNVFISNKLMDEEIPSLIPPSISAINPTYQPASIIPSVDLSSTSSSTSSSVTGTFEAPQISLDHSDYDRIDILNYMNRIFLENQKK